MVNFEVLHEHGWSQAAMAEKIERLRGALKDIRDEVPKVDIHFQGKVATDIAAAALVTVEQTEDGK